MYLPPPVPIVRDGGIRHFIGITYAAPIGYRPLQLDLWVPESEAPPPLVVWVHGGGWMFGDRRYLPETLRPNQLFEAVVAAGLAVATIDYRHSKEAVYPAQLHDAKAAIRYLRAHAGELGVDTARVGMWGESAGGHLAALVGLTGHRADLEGPRGVTGPSSAVDAVVDGYGVSDVPSMPRRDTPPPEMVARLHPDLLVEPLDVLLAGVDDATVADASPTTHVRPDSPPFLFVHGDADWLVPIKQSELLAERLAEAGVATDLIRVPGAGHIFDGASNIDELVRRSVDYLAHALRPVAS
jgi:acetyl esterase/lipase